MEYFYPVPTDYLETDYKREMIKFCLWEKTNLNDTTGISINYIRERCGYSENNRNKNSFSSYIRFTLKELISKKELAQVYGDDVLTASGVSYLVFNVLEKFNDTPTKTFAKLTIPVFDVLMAIKSPISKPVLLKIYTYMRSRMIENKQQAYGFHYGLEKTIVRDLRLNRKTIDTCLDAFVDHNLFIKYTTGSCYIDGEPRNVPNIYVLPDDQAENNIKALLEELKQRYRVEDFAPVLAPSANSE